RSLATVGLAACCAVPLAAMLIVIETALFRPAAELTGWTTFAGLMFSTHVAIGLFEGGLTVLLVAALAPLATFASSRPARGYFLAGVAAGLLALALLLPFSSSLPDGYQAASQSSGMAWLLGN